MPKRLEALRQGKVAAVSLMEPWISVAQKQGLRILIESHSTRSEAAGDDLDGPTLAKMFRAQARAVELLEKDPTPYLHYLARETGGLVVLTSTGSVAGITDSTSLRYDSGTPSALAPAVSEEESSQISKA